MAPAPSAPRSGPRSLWAEEGPFRSSAEYSTWSIVRRVRCSAQSSPARHQDGHPPPALRSGGRDPLAGRKPNSAFLANPALPRPRATKASRGDPARSESLRTPADVARGLQALVPERDPGQRVAEAGHPSARRRISPPQIVKTISCGRPDESEADAGAPRWPRDRPRWGRSRGIAGGRRWPRGIAPSDRRSAPDPGARSGNRDG